MRFQARDYQHKIIDKITSSSAAFVICKMGGGKTACTLEAIRQLKDACAIDRVLIIAPKRVAEHTWPSEQGNWDDFSGMSFRVAIGSPKQRIDAIAAGADITIINRENIPWLVKHTGKGWPFDMVVIDESSSFKNPSSQRFKALKRIRALTDRWVLLTGTPTPNSLLELWPQVYLLDGGERLFKTFTQYKQRWFDADYMGYKWSAKKGADEAIQKAIEDVCVVVDRYDGLPARIDLIERVDLPKNARDVYEQVRTEMLVELEHSDITAVNAAALMGKLQQVAGGTVYDDERKGNIIHSAKLDALESLIESAEGQSVLVAYHYKHDLARIKERIQQAVEIKSDAAIDRWNRGEIPVLLAHPASAGHGLNLQDGGSIIVWYGPTWSSELKQQFDARLYRQGQTNPVTIYTIVADDTVDDQILDAVAGKVTVQDALIAAVRK